MNSRKKKNFWFCFSDRRQEDGLQKKTNQVRNPEDRFSHNDAHISLGLKMQWYCRLPMKVCWTNFYYPKVPKFSDARKLCCNVPKTSTKRPNLRVFRQKDANGKVNNEDPDQSAPLVAV